MPSRILEPRWVGRVVADAIHADMLATHGGLAGPPDDELLEGALARPRQRWSFDENTDMSALAAAYAFGIARGHPFADGNKRVAFVVMAVFLGLNGLDLVAEDTDVVTTMIALAAGELEEAELSDWIRQHVRPRPGGSL